MGGRSLETIETNSRIYCEHYERLPGRNVVMSGPSPRERNIRAGGPAFAVAVDGVAGQQKE